MCVSVRNDGMNVTLRRDWVCFSLQALRMMSFDAGTFLFHTMLCGLWQYRPISAAHQKSQTTIGKPWSNPLFILSSESRSLCICKSGYTVGLFTMWFILKSQGSYTVSFKINAPCKLMFFWTAWWTFLIVPGVAKQAIHWTAAATYCKCIHNALKIIKRFWSPCRIPWFEVV